LLLDNETNVGVLYGAWRAVVPLVEINNGNQYSQTTVFMAWRMRLIQRDYREEQIPAGIGFISKGKLVAPAIKGEIIDDVMCRDVQYRLNMRCQVGIEHEMSSGY
jgi:hypothetical protein